MTLLSVVLYVGLWLCLAVWAWSMRVRRLPARAELSTPHRPTHLGRLYDQDEDVEVIGAF